MVHQFKNNGLNIVLDVNSGKVFVPDDMTYRIIGLYENKTTDEIKNELSSEYPAEEIEEGIKEVSELKEKGVLFSEDTFMPVAEAFMERRKPVIKALCLHIAHDCNLACKYCFAEEGEYHGKRELMPAEVGKRALDLLVESSGDRKNLEVDFFGGEPLMNWNAVKEIVLYGREIEKKNNKRFRFTLTTNGILLNKEIASFLNEEMSNVVLSIDGRKEVNDNARPFRNGMGSYDIILPKFLELAEERNQENYYVRGTFTRWNKDFSRDVLHLADLGFKQISVEPVVSEEDRDYSIREEDLPEIFDQYDLLAKEMLKRNREGKGFNFFHFMIDMSGGPCIYKRLTGCGSGYEYLAVTPTGDLYPCHQFVGNREFLLGDVYKGIVRPDIIKEFSDCNIYKKPKCRDCFAKFYCSGGCAANAYMEHKDIYDTYDIGCALMKKRIECAIMLKAAMAEDGGKLS